MSRNAKLKNILDGLLDYVWSAEFKGSDLQDDEHCLRSALYKAYDLGKDCSEKDYTLTISYGEICKCYDLEINDQDDDVVVYVDYVFTSRQEAEEVADYLLEMLRRTDNETCNVRSRDVE